MTPTAPIRSRWLLLFVVLALFAASCGGGDDDSADGGDDTSDDTDAGDDTSGDDASDGSGGDDEPSDDDTGDDSDTPDIGIGGVDVDSFCEASRENDALSDSFNPLAGPDEVRRQMLEARDRLSTAIPLAPGEIQGDLGIVLDGFEQMISILESHDWDFLAAADDIEALTELPEQTAASDRIDQWELDNCGIPIDDGGDDGDTLGDNPFADPNVMMALLETESGRELFIDGMTEDGDLTREQAGCLIDTLDLELLFALGQGEEPTGEMLPMLFGAFDTCGIDPSGF